MFDIRFDILSINRLLRAGVNVSEQQGRSNIHCSVGALATNLAAKAEQAVSRRWEKLVQTRYIHLYCRSTIVHTCISIYISFQ